MLHIRLQLFTITTIFFYYNYTCRRVKWGEQGTYETLATPSLTTTTPFKSQKILFNKRALGFKFTPTKKAISYISHLPILEPVLKPALPSYPIYSNSLPLPSLTFYGPPPPPPPSFARFCDTRISSQRLLSGFIDFI